MSGYGFHVQQNFPYVVLLRIPEPPGQMVIDVPFQLAILQG
jgi:hypothetical protein